MAAAASNQMPLLWHPQMDELVAIGVEFLPGADVSLHDFYESLEHEHQYNIDGTHRKIFPTGTIRKKANSKRQIALRSKKRQTNWETPTFSEELYSWIRQNDIIDRLYAFANNLPLPQTNNEDTMSNNNQNNERTGGGRVRFDNEHESLNRQDYYKGADLKHQGGKEDGELPVHEVNCKLFEMDGRQLSVSIGEWQGGQQHTNLPQTSMVATPTYLYSVALEERPDAPSELTTRFKVVWELPLNLDALPSGGSGTTPPRRTRTSSYARRVANFQQTPGN